MNNQPAKETIMRGTTRLKGSWSCEEIESQFSTGQQSRLLEVIARIEVDGQSAKLRIRVKRDSYDFQSYAVADAFDMRSMQWNTIASVPYSQMAANRLPYGGPFTDEEKASMRNDVVTLKHKVMHILEK